MCPSTSKTLLFQTIQDYIKKNETMVKNNYLEPNKMMLVSQAL
jgi:hypothetical protein